MRALAIAVVLFAVLAGPASATGGSSGAAATQEQAPATRQERLTSAESFLPQPTFSASVLHRYSTQGTIVVDMGLDIQDEALRHRAQLNAPRVRDALRTAIATYALTYYRERTAPDTVQLTRLLQQATDRVLGAQGAQVLLVNIIYQRRQG
jgi:hypothetical protein